MAGTMYEMYVTASVITSVEEEEALAQARCSARRVEYRWMRANNEWGARCRMGGGTGPAGVGGQTSSTPAHWTAEEWR